MLRARHKELVDEMISRGMNHKSNIQIIQLRFLSIEQMAVRINKTEALNALINRCPKCRDKYNMKRLLSLGTVLRIWIMIATCTDLRCPIFLMVRF